MLSLFLLLVAVLLFVVSSATLWWMMHAWRTPDRYAGTDYSEADFPQLSFSIIMPCRDEREDVMKNTLDRLLNQTHPRCEIIISVGDDDIETVARARRLANQNPDRVRVSVNRDLVKNKPRQLNTALEMCRNEIVGIIDAESLTQPDLLRHVDATFRSRNADVVQGAVHLVNFRSRWFSLRNCLEYRIWFRSRLHGHANSGFIPLGGNTVFIKRELLEQVGGWDGDCLAEDCEIGVRLSVLRKKIVCAYDPALTTLEEAPSSVAQFIKQRTRWALGFMQVMSKGDWKRLPTRAQRFGGWWTLSQQYAMAFAGLIFPIGIIIAIFAKVHTLVAMLSFLPLIPVALTLAFEMLVLHEFGKDLRFKIKLRDYAMLLITTPLYQALLAYAALRATYKFVRKDFGWEKTQHDGDHIDMNLHVFRTEGRA
jgi:glycosyltransferase XagB